MLTVYINDLSFFLGLQVRIMFYDASLIISDLCRAGYETIVSYCINVADYAVELNKISIALGVFVTLFRIFDLFV